MNIETRSILAGVKYYGAEVKQSWADASSRYGPTDQHFHSMLRRDLAATFANEHVGDIQVFDEPQYKVRRLTAYVLSRREMIELLDQAYEAGMKRAQDMNQLSFYGGAP